MKDLYLPKKKSGIEIPSFTPMMRFEFPENIQFDINTITRQIHVEFVEEVENDIVAAIATMARNAGVSDLYILYKKFVLDALREKMERDALMKEVFND